MVYALRGDPRGDRPRLRAAVRAIPDRPDDGTPSSEARPRPAHAPLKAGEPALEAGDTGLEHADVGVDARRRARGPFGPSQTSGTDVAVVEDESGTRTHGPAQQRSDNQENDELQRDAVLLAPSGMGAESQSRLARATSSGTVCPPGNSR